ncbi:MAG: hypothetical protein JJ959_17355 [Nisaea sp.]|uniref:hypothetical protein n=1 Tax=Nisaea sp. TaxID=2024842 RepID=UPI001B201480|nr:hypothetical protein [Nisaea sp.]MBO6562316.1 hypothetical protein [Nisaea sp.]
MFAPPLETKILPQIFKDWRVLLLAAVWLGSVAGLFVSAPMLDHLTGIGLLIFVLLTLPKARRETKFLMLGGGLITAVLLLTVAGPADALRGLERSLIFAGLLPTLQMTKAVALRMPSVRISQERLASLPGQAADVGIAIGTTVFGSVLNTGAFALVSAVIKQDATEERRLTAARAAMRGMNISVLWSPFFVGFAVAGTYLPQVELWQIVPFGFFCVCLSIAIALAMFARPFSLGAVRDSLACLGPIAPRLGFAAGTVILVGALTPLSTLGAIIVVMPVLCAIQFQRHPEQVRPVFEETATAMSRMGDDLALIVVAMVVGTTAGEADALIVHVAPLLEGGLPAPVLLAALIGIQLLPAVVGIHPIITGTIFLAALTSLPHGVLPLALYEAMLAGWGLGSMISIASLSVVTAGSMFGVRPLVVAIGPNLLYVLVVWAVLVPLLSAVHYAFI